MKRKRQELSKGDIVKFQAANPYGRDDLYTIKAVAQQSEKDHHRIFELRGSGGKTRFAKGAELRLANRKERQAVPV